MRLENEEEIQEYVDNLSVAQIKVLMEALEESKKRRGRKHIPGRYTKASFWGYELDLQEIIRFNSDDQKYINRLRVIGNCSKTEQEAVFIHNQRKAYINLIDKIHELNDGWRPDWDEGKQSKYNFRYTHDGKEILINENFRIQNHKSELYFSSHEIGKQILKDLYPVFAALWEDYNE